MKSTYASKILDPRWQKKRLEILNDAKWMCELCFEEKNTLHVHHKNYISGNEPWEYERHQLVVLCNSCHENAHLEENWLQEVLTNFQLDGPLNRMEIANLLAGIIGYPLEYNKQNKRSIFVHSIGIEVSKLLNKGIE